MNDRAGVIEAVDIFAGYPGIEVLRGVSLTARPGELLGLLGPNGAGKSTLLRVLAGIHKPASGAVAVDGENVFALTDRERARRIAVVPQHSEIPFGPRVCSVALMGRYAHVPAFSGYGPEDEAIAARALGEAGVAHLAGRALSALSGGEQKRVFIARALAQQARIMLLDEASSGLDPARAIEIHDLLRRKCRQGAAVVIAIHDLNLAALYCDRLVFLKDGRVAAQGPTAEVFRAEVIARIYDTTPELVRHPRLGIAQALFVPGAAETGRFPVNEETPGRPAPDPADPADPADLADPAEKSSTRQ
jgi:iron complex transport system ATP-binding protein